MLRTNVNRKKRENYRCAIFGSLTEQHDKRDRFAQKDDENHAQAPPVPQGATMILLRFLSILAGCLVMMAPPVLLSEGSGGPRFFDGRTVLVMMAALAVVSASFFYIGFAAKKMRKSATLRAIGALLLAVPFAGSTALLWRGGQPTELWGAGLLFCFTTLLFVAFVFPAGQRHKHRPMRRRESLAS
jgi:ABC-type multidrug transport system permease subunit